MALTDDTSNLPTQQIALASVGERCVNCGAPLVSDQRYCVNCGERRGKPRFALAEGPAPVAETVTRVTRRPRGRPPRTSAAFNLIAGVATLLLAMGVGVLIGHNSNSSSNNRTAASNQPIVITSGAGTPAGSATTASGNGSSGSSGSGAHAKSGRSARASTAKAPPKVVVQKAAAAASKVVGGNAAVAAPTATQGSSCAAGTAGCQGGKLTGNYFGQ